MINFRSPLRPLPSERNALADLVAAAREANIHPLLLTSEGMLRRCYPDFFPRFEEAAREEEARDRAARAPCPKRPAS